MHPVSSSSSKIYRVFLSFVLRNKADVNLFWKIWGPQMLASDQMIKRLETSLNVFYNYWMDVQLFFLRIERVLGHCITASVWYKTSLYRAWLRLNAFKVLACSTACLLACQLACLPVCLLSCWQSFTP